MKRKQYTDSIMQLGIFGHVDKVLTQTGQSKEANAGLKNNAVYDATKSIRCIIARCTAVRFIGK